MRRASWRLQRLLLAACWDTQASLSAVDSRQHTSQAAPAKPAMAVEMVPSVVAMPSHARNVRSLAK